MVLIIDNNDSFTHNVKHSLLGLGYKVAIVCSFNTTVQIIEETRPTHIIISPGPGKPEDAGISIKVIKHFQDRIPILGICLGHQAIAYAHGANVLQSKEIYHGKTSRISHLGKRCLKGIESPFRATRYHSLIVEETSLPKEFEITARCENGEIMAIAHQSFLLEGVQFHPESVASEHGIEIFNNFLRS